MRRCAPAARWLTRAVHPVPQPRAGISIVRNDAIPGPAEFERLNQAITVARIEVTIAAEYPLAQAAQAHERLHSGHVLGKVVLRVH